MSQVLRHGENAASPGPERAGSLGGLRKLISSQGARDYGA